jgi:CMP-N,N'-diacetyllegionaminic acid synthase
LTLNKGFGIAEGFNGKRGMSLEVKAKFSQNTIALIPARGGSKGVARKNMRVVGGKPLIGHTIDAAMTSKRISAVYLSSEDQEILDYGQSRGLITVKRPLEYASDTSTASDVVGHFIETLPADLRAKDPIIVYLQPTSPLRSGQHIDLAIDSMLSKGASVLTAICKMKQSPYKSLTIDEKGYLSPLFSETLLNANRQSLKDAYYPNGSIYIFYLSQFKGRFPTNNSVPYLMTERESLDVDTEEDFDLLRTIMDGAL